MKNTKKSTLSGVALAVAWFGVGSAAWADEPAQQPPAPPPAATVPTPATPATPGAAAAAAAPISPLIAPTITGPLAIQLLPPKYSLG
ncbi:MAG: hypothetical protein ACREEZ_11795, partial [Stellaceae bacterium]